MGYIDDNLISGEQVVYRTKLHWVIFLWPIICAVIAFMFFAGGGGTAAAGGFFLKVLPIFWTIKRLV